MRPRTVSPEAFAADAAFWIERLELAPAVVVGQSLGGITALLLAARRPDLVRALVVAEATPARDPEALGVVRSWFAAWPLPFPSEREALAFFGGDTLRARAWCAGLERRADGLWPAFEPEVLLDALGRANEREHWDDWARIRCPALVVRAADGVPAAEVQRMADALPGTTRGRDRGRRARRPSRPARALARGGARLPGRPLTSAQVGSGPNRAPGTSSGGLRR